MEACRLLAAMVQLQQQPLVVDDGDLSLAVGVAGEVLPETLERMIRLCRAVLVDAQALIRAFGAEGDGSGAAVRHVALEGTPYARLLQRVAFLKASSEEAPYVGVVPASRSARAIDGGEDGDRT